MSIVFKSTTANSIKTLTDDGVFIVSYKFNNSLLQLQRQSTKAAVLSTITNDIDFSDRLVEPVSNLIQKHGDVECTIEKVTPNSALLLIPYTGTLVYGYLIHLTYIEPETNPKKYTPTRMTQMYSIIDLTGATFTAPLNQLHLLCTLLRDIPASIDTGTILDCLVLMANYELAECVNGSLFGKFLMRFTDGVDSFTVTTPMSDSATTIPEDQLGAVSRLHSRQFATKTPSEIFDLVKAMSIDGVSVKTIDCPNGELTITLSESHNIVMDGILPSEYLECIYSHIESELTRITVKGFGNQAFDCYGKILSFKHNVWVN